MLDAEGMPIIVHACRCRKEMVALRYADILCTSPDGRGLLKRPEVMCEIIRHSPKTALSILDKFCVSNGTRPSGEWIYDFELSLIDPNPKTYKRSEEICPLQLIVDLELQNILQHRLVTRVLSNKWNGYVKKRFYFFSILYVVFMASFGRFHFEDNLWSKYTVSGFVVVAGFPLVIFELLQIKSSIKHKKMWRDLKCCKAPDYFMHGKNWLDLFVILTGYASIALHLFSYPIPVFDAFVFFIVYIHSLNISIGFPSIGPLVLILQKTLLEDIPKFVLMGTVLVFSFAGPLGILLRHAQEKNELSVDSTFLGQFHSLSLGLLGIFDFEIEATRDAAGILGFGVILTFNIVLVIAFLNMLIAAMSYTFANIYENVESTFRLHRAKYIIDMDDAFDIHHLAWKSSQRVTAFPTNADLQMSAN